MLANLHKFVTIYRRVDDESVLETFFSETHLMLLEQLPGLVKTEIGRITYKPGGDSRFHMMVEAYFDSSDDLKSAFLTPVGIELMQALKPWAEAGIITWFYCDSWEEETTDE